MLLVTGARLGDIFGRRRLFLIGSAGFTLMSVACAAAPSPGLLIVFRALQGAFGALLIPQGFGMLKEVFPDEEMPKVFAAFGPTMGLSAIIAPILAGVLISADLWGTGWRLVFLINLPVGAIAFAAALKVLPRGASHPGVRLDVIGMVLVGLAMVGIVYPLIQGREDGWPAWTFAMLAAGTVLLAVFVGYERRRRESPLIEIGLLRNRTYMSGMAVVLAYFAAYAGVLLIVSLFCQLGEHFTPIHAGLTLVPMMAGLIASMLISLRLGDKLGRHQVHIGLALVAAGVIALALTADNTHSLSSWELAPSLLVIGLGSSLSFSQLFDIILARVPIQEIGSASGVLNAIEQLAAALGVAVLGTVFLSRLTPGHVPTHALAITAWVTPDPAGNHVRTRVPTTHPRPR